VDDWGGGMSVVLCCGSTCQLSQAMDSCIPRHGTISPCQSAANTNAFTFSSHRPCHLEELEETTTPPGHVDEDYSEGPEIS